MEETAAAAPQIDGSLLLLLYGDAGPIPDDELKQLPFVAVKLYSAAGDAAVHVDPQRCSQALVERAHKLDPQGSSAAASRCLVFAVRLLQGAVGTAAGPVTRIDPALLELLCGGGPPANLAELPWVAVNGDRRRGMVPAVHPQRCADALRRRAAELKQIPDPSQKDVSDGHRCEELAAKLGGGRSGRDLAVQAMHAVAEAAAAAHRGARAATVTAESAELVAATAAVHADGAHARCAAAEQRCAELEQQLQRVAEELAEQRLAAAAARKQSGAEMDTGQVMSELAAVRQQATAAAQAAAAAVQGRTEAEDRLSRAETELKELRAAFTRMVMDDVAHRSSLLLSAEHAALLQHYSLEFDALATSPLRFLHFLHLPLLLRRGDGGSTDAGRVVLPLTASVWDLKTAAHKRGAPNPFWQEVSIGGRLLDVSGGMRLSRSAMIRTDGVTAAVEIRQHPLHPAAHAPTVSAGATHAAVLLQCGGFRVWGETVSESPLSGDVDAVCAGTDFTAAVVAGALKVWGKGREADRIRRDVRQLSDREVVCCSAFSDSLAAVTSDGHLYLCGSIRDATAVPSDLQGRVAAVAVGGGFVVAVTADGAVRLFGKDLQPADVDLGGRAAVSVSADWSHYAAVLDDGSVLCSGSNSHGQCTVPADLHSAVSCSCGNYFTVALRRDGTLSWWGKVPPHQKIAEAGRIAAVSACTNYAAAVTVDGKLVADGTPVSRGWIVGKNSASGLYDPPHVAVRGLAAASGSPAPV